VSDEVISKIHAAYPALNIMWLMFGDGQMFVSGATGTSEIPASHNLSKTPQSGNLFMGSSSDDIGTSKSPRQPSTISFGDDSTVQNSGAMALSNALQSMARKSANSSPSPGRRIVNIMIFYDDNSFEQIVPR